ncbi:MAG: ARMT1-like domain-containing protein [Chloroflexota bacterium]|nr:ARMT1-like domain-containing protein [Chloroflexota bacterium]
MKTYIDCYPCFLRQSIEASRMAGADEAQQREVILKVMDQLKTLPPGATPPEIGLDIHRTVREITGNADPYLKAKKESTEKALSLLPKLREVLDASDDKLETAIRLSIAGNIIDFGLNKTYDLWEEVERVLRQDIAINDIVLLRKKLQEAKTLLFLGDNAGETVFDVLLIETLSKPVTYVTRGGPVLNDATREDAHAAGIDKVAEVIDTGVQAPGVILSMSSKAFLEKFYRAELILAKGMGNYEALSEVHAPIFFLLQMKCPVIGGDIEAPVGSTVVKRGRGIL